MENIAIKNPIKSQRNKLLNTLAICLIGGSMLVACGGDTQNSADSGSKLLANGEACSAAWISTTAYSGGAKVSYNGVNYTAAFWTQGNNPSTSNGPAGSGQPWVAGFTCGGAMTTTTTAKASTTTTGAASTTTTRASSTTTGGSTTTTKTSTTTTTGSICAAYVAGAAYASGQTVANAGGFYTCDVAGWCSSGATAYEPGVGWAWSSAWHVASAGVCGATSTTKATTTTTGATTSTTKLTTTTTGSGSTTTTANTTTTTAGTGSGLPRHALVGYMHASFANGSGYIPMANVSNAWDIINLSFAEPDSPTSGNLHFNRCPVSECANVESDAAFLAAIKAKQAAGKKVLISIGGANGQVQLTTTAARDAFVNSVSAIIDKWSLDGLDVDFEGHSIYLNNGDRDFKNPTTPVVVNLISALKSLKTRYGSKFVLTMAPETLLLQGGRMFYGSGVWGGADTRNGVYLPVIHAVRDFLTIVHAQNYNSGPVAGANGTYYSAGTIDFNVALSDMMITGFPIEGNAANFWPGLRPDQVGFGLPANAQAAGSGQMTTADTEKAFDCLTKGINCASYKPAQAYPTFRALMTWSINWDKFNNFEFSNAHRAYFNANP